MEMTGIGEAAQFMEVGIRGIDMALRLTGSFAGWTVEKAIQLLKFVIARCDEARKTPEILKKGELRVDQLLKWNAENGYKSCVMQIDEDLAEDFVEYCNQNKLSYAFLKDLNKSDECMEVVYSEAQAEAFTVYIQNHRENARAYSFDAYTANAEPDQIQKVDQSISREVAENLKREVNRYGTPIEEKSPVKSEQVLSENRNVKRDPVPNVSPTQVSFDTLTEQLEHVSAVTMPFAMLSDWNEMCATQSVPYTLLRSTADNSELTVAVSELDYNIVDPFLKDKSLEKESLVQFFSEHPDFEPSEKMKESARAGSNIALSDNDHFTKIDKKQIVDTNDYSVKLAVWNKEAERREYINLPLAQIYKTKDPDKFQVILPEKERIKTYKQPKFKSDNETIPQIPTRTFSGKNVSEMASHTEKHFDMQRKDAKIKAPIASQPKKFVNKKKAKSR